MGPRTLWWGGCAWDSFALPHLLRAARTSVLVATRCPACGTPHAWKRDQAPSAGRRAGGPLPGTRRPDVGLTSCTPARTSACSAPRIAWSDWLAATGSARGYVLDLGTLWRLAAHWYDGRLDRGYVRREPSQAAAYLRGVGLAGSFWGL